MEKSCCVWVIESVTSLPDAHSYLLTYIRAGSLLLRNLFHLPLRRRSATTMRLIAKWDTLSYRWAANG